MGTGTCTQGCWDADVFVYSKGCVRVGAFCLSSATLLFSHSSPWGVSQILNSSSTAVSERARLQGFVCVSTGDCIRRCSSITDGAVVSSVVLVWQ